MHRIPLVLPTPSIFWNRNLPEHILFEQALTPTNVKEAEDFLTILYEETVAYGRESFMIAEDYVSRANALDYTNYNDITEGLRLLNKAVLRAPKNSSSLTTALKLRGNLYFNRCLFEAAINDYTMFLHIDCYEGGCEERCQVHGNLVIAYYILRQYSKSKKQLRSYKKYRAKLEHKGTVNASIHKIDQQIQNFANELDEVENYMPKFSENTKFSAPYKGFNNSNDIPSTSALCYIKQEQSGVYACCSIPKESDVLMERPLMKNVNLPFVQCELCFQQTDQIYTCLECRYKTYCSLNCIEKDMASHRQECAGYKNLILLILDAKDLFRMFLNVSSLLHEHIFSRKSFRNLTTAEAVLANITTTIDELDKNSEEYLKLMNKTPPYHQLSRMQYSTLVVTAFRLAIFIDKKTNIIEEYYKKLKMPLREKIILLGSILMRLHCHILTNTFDFEFTYPLRVYKPVYKNIHDQIADLLGLFKPQNGYAGCASEYFNVSENNIIEHFTDIKKQPSGDSTIESFKPLLPRISRPMSTYKDKLAAIYFNADKADSLLFGDMADSALSDESIALICLKVSEMSEFERCSFVQKFAINFHIYFVEFFLEMAARSNGYQQILSLYCTSLRKFRHSCEPNVAVVVLENGIVLGKTLREIKEGEELFVCYKAHYLCHIRPDRELFLKNLNVVCDCKYCKMPRIEEPTNLRSTIYCDTCTDVPITQAEEKCVRCNRSYADLLSKYRKDLHVLSDKLLQLSTSNAEELEIYILFIMLSHRAAKYFSPWHEARIQIELNYTRFLALKNIAKQCCENLISIDFFIGDNYEDSWRYTFYTDMLIIIKIVLYYNIDEGLYTTSLSSLEEIWKLGVKILKQQKSYISLYETFDFECAAVMQDLRQFMKWKDILLRNGLHLNHNNLKDDLDIKKYKSADEEEKMPDLSKILI